jgi:hypothetical protein
MWDALLDSRTAVMGANKTYQTKSNNRLIIGESDEFKRLRHAVTKAHDDRERAIRNVCRLYGVNRLDALPSAIRVATLALLDETVIRPAR